MASWKKVLTDSNSIKDLSDVYDSMSPSDGQVLTFDTTNGWQAETPSGGGSANMENSATAPTSAGEFNDGARLLIDLYGTSPSATAGNLVSMGGSNVANVGAQSTTAAATGMLTFVTDAGDADELLLEGVIRLSSTTTTALLPTGAKKGTPVYMSTTAGAVTNTAPSTAGDFVRVVGHVLDAANRTIYFKPSVDWIEL